MYSRPSSTHITRSRGEEPSSRAKERPQRPLGNLRKCYFWLFRRGKARQGGRACAPKLSNGCPRVRSTTCEFIIDSSSAFLALGNRPSRAVPDVCAATPLLKSLQPHRTASPFVFHPLVFLLSPLDPPPSVPSPPFDPPCPPLVPCSTADLLLPLKYVFGPLL